MREAFPAYAGMNRFSSNPSLSVDRVPRVCGDEPALQTRMAAQTARSPRMRG